MPSASDCAPWDAYSIEWGRRATACSGLHRTSLTRGEAGFRMRPMRVHRGMGRFALAWAVAGILAGSAPAVEAAAPAPPPSPYTAMLRPTTLAPVPSGGGTVRLSQRSLLVELRRGPARMAFDVFVCARKQADAFVF